MFFFVFPSDLRRLLIGWPAFSVCRVSFSGYLSIGGATATGGRLMSLTITDKKKKSVIAYQVGTEHNECNSFNKKKKHPKVDNTSGARYLAPTKKNNKIQYLHFFFGSTNTRKKKDPKSPFPSGARFDRRSPSIRHKKNDFFLLKKKSQARRVGGGVA